MKRGFVIAALLASASALAPACAAEQDEALAPGSAAAGAAGAAGAAADAGSDGPITLPDSTAPDPDAEVCVAESFGAEEVPLAMIVLVDRSGSMRSNEKFESARQAVVTFADRGDVVGMKMGLQVFPTVQDTNQCDANAFRRLMVPIEPLPDNTIAIRDALIEIVADGTNTPMRSALEGSIAAARDLLEVDPVQEAVVILVTDGEPAGCGDLSGVVTVAQNGANPPTGNARVRTFVAGMSGADFANLDQIASAGGGAPHAFDVGGGSESATALVEALEAIRSGALGCEYVLPEPTINGRLDLDQVEVVYTPGDNDPSERIRRVDDEAACGETTGGFYYDDPLDPTRIILCDASCDHVRASTGNASVQVRFGCIYVPA